MSNMPADATRPDVPRQSSYAYVNKAFDFV